MNVLRILRRVFSSESGQLLLVGCGIAVALGLMWSDAKFEPWSGYGLRAFLSFCIAAVAFGHVRSMLSRERRRRWREVIIGRPLVAILSVISALWTYVFATVMLWLEFRHSARAADLRLGLMMSLFLVQLCLWLAGDHYEKRDGKLLAATESREPQSG